MAKKKQKSVVGLVVVAALIGAAIGAAVFNSSAGDPPPMPPVVDKGDQYDDSWGRLERPAASAAVTHILISWEGTGVATKEPGRTKEQARELVEGIWRRYRDNQDEGYWKELQVTYNEDTGPVHKVYRVPEDSLVEPFKQGALTTLPTYARIIESQFGYHLIRRE